jgi:tellurite resistance protein TerC
LKVEKFNRKEGGVRLVRRLVPITKRTQGDRLFISKKGVRAATPLFLALVMVESSDVIIALDSIPAVFAVTRDPFIVYSSNVFAIMGLRSSTFCSPMSWECSST